MTTRNTLPTHWRQDRALQRRLFKLFDDFFTNPFSEGMFEPGLGLFGSSQQALPQGSYEEFMPACDVGETDSHFLVSFDLPGINKSDIKIELRDQQLVVSGHRKEEFKGHVSRERYYGEFRRSFTLPSNIDPGKVEAKYENGVLQISIPKTEATSAKQIPIKEGKLVESKASSTKAA